MAGQQKLNLILYNLKPDGTIVSEMIQAFREGSRYSLILHNLKTLEEVQALIPTLPNGIFLFCVYDSDSLTSLINTLKFLKPYLKKNFFKASGFNDLDNPKVEMVLKKSGITEIIEADINLKTIRYKVDVWFKSLKSQKTKTFSAAATKEIVIEQKTAPKAKLHQTPPNATDDVAATQAPPVTPAVTPSGGRAPTSATLDSVAPLAPDSIPSPADEEVKTEQPKGDKTVLVNLPPLEIDEDIWILKSEDDCKLIIKRWFVRLLGPGPNIAKWEKVPTPNTTKPMWKFIPKDEKNPDNNLFFFSTGSWFFYGPKPEFDWKLKGWNFTGDFINLFFRKGDANFEKLVLTNDGLKLAENSNKAMSIEHNILATILTEEESNHNDGENQDKDPSNPSYYYGDINEQEKAKEGHLSGSVDGTDDESTEHLEGNIKTEKITSEHLSGTKGKEYDQEGHWKGNLKQNDVKENTKVKSVTEYKGPKYRGALSGKIKKDKKEEPKKEPLVSDFSDQPSLDGPELDNIKNETPPPSKSFEETAGTSETPKKRLTQVELPSPEKLDSLLDEFLEDISIESGELKINLIYHDSPTVHENEIECKLFDMFDGEITLKTITSDELEPKKVKLSLIFQYNNKENRIEYQGDITDITPTPDEQYYVSIKLEDFDQSIFDQFLEQYEERQVNVSKFLDRVKGTG